MATTLTGTPATAGAAADQQNPLPKMAAIMLITVLLAWFSTYRITHAGDWLPTVPDRIGVWDGIDTPLPDDVLSKLGGPQAVGREYNQIFNEPIRVSIIAANGFDAYHEPTVCVATNGFHLTAVKTFPIDGPGSGNVRAMVFHRSDNVVGDIRIMMYYWQQNKDGTTATDAVMGNYRDILSRFKTGFGAVFLGHKTCMVRVYAPIGPDDKDGVQTQRSINEISRELYRALKKSGAEDR